MRSSRHSARRLSSSVRAGYTGTGSGPTTELRAAQPEKGLHYCKGLIPASGRRATLPAAINRCRPMGSGTRYRRLADHSRHRTWRRSPPPSGIRAANSRRGNTHDRPRGRGPPMGGILFRGAAGGITRLAGPRRPGKKISSMKDLLPLLEQIVKMGKPLLNHCRGCRGRSTGYAGAKLAATSRQESPCSRSAATFWAEASPLP